ncbi:MAG: hypothetical protein HWE27_06035 [Gammaproteobacteria bacterium]|nr:hypothetical protein [Gammaproteobacteria bacterium]
MNKILILLGTLYAISALADAPGEKVDSFVKLKELTGHWVKEGGSPEKFYISFYTSANGSVLVEDWISNGVSRSLTVYHRDGERLLATHYCPQENQPRLKLKESSNENEISFVFKDATNLEDLNENHQHSLSFEFVDKDTLIRKESYISSGTLAPSTLKLIRK